MIILSIVLMSIGFVLVTLSNVAYMEKTRSGVLIVEVPPGTSVKRFSVAGLVEIRAEVPRGVTLYFLTEVQYLIYMREGKLPKTYVTTEESTLYVQNPEYIVAISERSKVVTVEVRYDVYTVTKPYALLAIPSYVVTIVGVWLLARWLMTRQWRVE